MIAFIMKTFATRSGIAGDELEQCEDPESLPALNPTGKDRTSSFSLQIHEASFAKVLVIATLHAWISCLLWFISIIKM